MEKRGRESIDKGGYGRSQLNSTTQASTERDVTVRNVTGRILESRKKCDWMEEDVTS